MPLPSRRGSSASAFPRSLSSIAVYVGGVALFLTFASWLLISAPIGTCMIVQTKGCLPDLNHTLVDVEVNDKAGEEPSDSSSQVPISRGSPPVSETVKTLDQPALDHAVSSNLTKENEADASSVSESEKIPDQQAHDHAVSSNSTKESEVDDTPTPGLSNNSIRMVSESTDSTTVQAPSDAKLRASPDLSSLPRNTTKTDSVDADCDLFQGNWFYDPAGPLYTNYTCPVVSPMQNCQGNGRPDKGYESWRWKPFQCDLPRFDGREFLELLRGKTLAFIGDSLARNQMESLLCLLWQVEVPKKRGNDMMERWKFKSTSTTIVRIWSAWLVHRTTERFGYVPEGVDKLHLDFPDEYFMDLVPTFDVVVLNTGHWFAKQSVYVRNNEVMGAMLWSPTRGYPPPTKISSIEAFEISLDTALTAFVTHPNYTGLTIVRTFSPDHYEGGEWNTGGTCTGKTRPLAPGELTQKGFTKIMYEKQVAGFNRAAKKVTNKSKFKLMDITDAFEYRNDGHMGLYRVPGPDKTRGADGKPLVQDCLHWCMPGPVDTWNELVLEIMRREL